MTSVASTQAIRASSSSLGRYGLLVIFAALHLLYNWAVPLGEGPDEPGHLAYVLFLAQQQRLPVQQLPPEASDVPGEGHQPPLAYLLAVPAVAWLPPAEQSIILTANPQFRWSGGDEPGAFQRASRELWPWQGLTLAWHAARAISGLWGVLTVLFAYLAARRLFAQADPLLPPLVAALVAFNPQFLFTTALVTNDALLAALGAALLWWSLPPLHYASSVAPDPPPRPLHTRALPWALVAGLLFGLALLTKQSALLLGPLLLWAGWWVAKGNLRRFLLITLAWGGMSLLVAGWWFLRNQHLYGDPFALGAFTAKFATQPFAWNNPEAWSGALRQLFASFWARFGWMSLHAPAWMLWLYAGLSLAALAGLIRLIATRGTGLPRSMLIGPLLASAMAVVWTLVFAYTAGLVAWQGRMLFPALAAFAILLAVGLQQLRINPLAIWSSLLLLALATPIQIIRPAYSWIALAPRTAEATLGQPVYARFAASWEQGVVIRGWKLEQPLAPGATLPVTLTWQSQGRVPQPWHVLVQLVDQEERIVASSLSQPRNDTLPFPLWTPGDWIADTHTLFLPATLPPSPYSLRIALVLPEENDRRQDIWNLDDTYFGDFATLGTIP